MAVCRRRQGSGASDEEPLHPTEDDEELDMEVDWDVEDEEDDEIEAEKEILNVVSQVHDSDLINTGALDTISQQYESLDYDTNFNSIFLDEMRSKGYRFVMKKVNMERHGSLNC